MSTRAKGFFLRNHKEVGLAISIFTLALFASATWFALREPFGPRPFTLLAFIVAGLWLNFLFSEIFRYRSLRQCDRYRDLCENILSSYRNVVLPMVSKLESESEKKSAEVESKN